MQDKVVVNTDDLGILDACLQPKSSIYCFVESKLGQTPQVSEIAIQLLDVLTKFFVKLFESIFLVGRESLNQLLFCFPKCFLDS